MSDLNHQDLDRLVDAIADRVRARLSAPHQPSPQAEAAGEGVWSQACVSCRFPKEACASCGFNPENRAVSQEAPKQIPTPTEMARLIDHTLLAANASREEVERICKEALRHRFWSVCVNSGNVRLAASYLSGSDTQVCAVVGFPLGAAAPGAKAFEAREAVRCGAGEIDMVMNIGALRSRDYGLVTEDIRKVVQAVPGKVVKVILETGMLDQTQKSIACALAKVAGATFVKTSTGFGPGGATAQDIALMRAIVGPELGVKASGGVGSYNDAVAMLKAGANRIGASRSVSIVTNTASGGAGY